MRLSLVAAFVCLALLGAVGQYTPVRGEGFPPPPGIPPGARPPIFLPKTSPSIAPDGELWLASIPVRYREELLLPLNNALNPLSAPGIVPSGVTVIPPSQGGIRALMVRAKDETAIEQFQLVLGMLDRPRYQVLLSVRCVTVDSAKADAFNTALLAAFTAKDDATAAMQQVIANLLSAPTTTLINSPVALVTDGQAVTCNFSESVLKLPAFNIKVSVPTNDAVLLAPSLQDTALVSGVVSGTQQVINGNFSILASGLPVYGKKGVEAGKEGMVILLPTVVAHPQNTNSFLLKLPAMAGDMGPIGVFGQPAQDDRYYFQ